MYLFISPSLCHLFFNLISVILTLPLYLFLFLPHSQETFNYSSLTEMASAGVGEEIIDNDYTWPLPWQLFQLMCARLWGALGFWEEREEGRETQTYEAMPVTWNKSKRRESRQAETKVCHFKIDVKEISQFKMLHSTSKQKNIMSPLFCFALWLSTIHWIIHAGKRWQWGRVKYK